MLLPTCTVFLLCVSTAVTNGLLASCSGRCGQTFSSSFPCQCNSQCVTHSDCCSDYGVQCHSCAGLCHSGYDRTKPCQCNDQCGHYGNCCHDYQSACSTTPTSCSTVEHVAQQMWDSDVNRLSPGDVTLNYQQHVTDASTDRASQKLFTNVNVAKLSGLTYRTFIALLDNYRPGKGDAESVTSSETVEENAFLDAILDTSVMQTLEAFLLCQNMITNRADMRQKLKTMWFDLYPRSGSSSIGDTSGFEHVMVGEYKSGSVVNGFHNWISFYKKEKSGELNYYGYVNRATVEQNFALVGSAFSWNGRGKDMGSFFVGVSPEFDLGIYSLCFFTHPGKSCRFTLESKPFSVQSYSSSGHIATAYASASWQDPSSSIVG